MKKLILITGVLLSTSLWSEVVYLNCEPIEGYEEIGNTSFVIDTEARLVKGGVAEVGYIEYGNKIQFLDKSSSRVNSYIYILDRIWGDLEKLIFDKEDDILDRAFFYKCIRNNPLF